MGAWALPGGWFDSAPGTPCAGPMPRWVASLVCWLRIAPLAGFLVGAVDLGGFLAAREVHLGAGLGVHVAGADQGFRIVRMRSTVRCSISRTKRS